jgi:predicted ATP-dependent serine protease
MDWGRVVQPAYPDLLLGIGALAEVSGPPGGGKSTYAAKMVNAIPGAALLVSAEEGIGPSLAARLARCQVRRDDFHIISRATVDQVVDLAVSKKVTALIVDSVHECAWSATDLRHLGEVVPTLVTVVAIMQVNKSGEPAGAMALLHEADVHVAVESMRWRLTKSRYQALEGVGGDVLTSQVMTGPMPVEMEPQS